MLKHGVYIKEQATSVSTPVVAASGIPFAVGTAPVQSAEKPAKLNVPVLCTSWDEAVEQLGYSDNWKDFTLCEVMYSHFQLFGMQPIILCNVLDPATHKEAVNIAEHAVSNGKVFLPAEAIADSVVVKAASGSESPYTKGKDYDTFYSNGTLVVEVSPDGDAKEATKLYISYSKVKPDGVDDNDIVAGFGAVDLCMATIGEIPDLLIAPGWSESSTVQAIMATKADSINGVMRAKALCDIDCTSSGATSYSAVYQKKLATNLVDPTQVACWPQVKLGDKQFHLSTQLAGLMAKVDSDNDGVPYESPSNKGLKCDSLVLADGTEVLMTLEQANVLNSNGIVTALKFMSGFVAWGNYTACYPANTDVKDYFLPIGRMFAWIGNTLVRTFWSKTDSPMTRRLLDNIKDSANTWLNGLVGSEFLLGARVEIVASENVLTDLMAGIVRIHIYITPPSPAQEIDFVLEYDPSYVTEALTE